MDSVTRTDSGTQSPTQTPYAGLISYLSFLNLWKGSSPSAPIEETKQVKQQTALEPSGIKMIWQTNFPNSGAVSGTADFISKANVSNKNAVGLLSVQNNYLFKPIKTWQVSLLGPDVYLGAEDSRVSYKGDLYFPAVSSPSDNGLLCISEDGSKECIYYSLGSDYDYWRLSPMNSTDDFKTMTCLSTDGYSFSLWNLNSSKPQKLFEQGGFKLLSGNVGAFKMIGVNAQTYSFEIWDLLERKMTNSIGNWLNQSGAQLRMGPYIPERDWQIIKSDTLFYCFDLANPKLLWSGVVSKSFDNLQVVDNKYVLIQCYNDNHIIVFSLEDGSYLRQFEIGNTFTLANLQMAALDAANNKIPLLYSLESGNLLKSFQEAPVNLDTLVLSKNLLVGYSRDNFLIATWNIATGSLISTFPLSSDKSYRLLEISDKYLVFLVLDKNASTQEKPHSTMISRRHKVDAKFAQVKPETSVPINPVSVLNLAIWDIQQQAFAGSISETLSQVSSAAPMLVSFKKGTLTCSWLSNTEGEQILIKDYAWESERLKS